MFKINDNYLKLPGSYLFFHHCKKLQLNIKGKSGCEKSSVLESAT